MEERDADNAELSWFRKREDFVQKLAQASAEVLVGLKSAEERGRIANAFLGPALNDLLDFEGDEPKPGPTND
jgi:hypothetical protein